MKIQQGDQPLYIQTAITPEVQYYSIFCVLTGMRACNKRTSQRNSKSVWLKCLGLK